MKPCRTLSSSNLGMYGARRTRGGSSRRAKLNPRRTIAVDRGIRRGFPATHFDILAYLMRCEARCQKGANGWLDMGVNPKFHSIGVEEFPQLVICQHQFAKIVDGGALSCYVFPGGSLSNGHSQLPASFRFIARFGALVDLAPTDEVLLPPHAPAPVNRPAPPFTHGRHVSHVFCPVQASCRDLGGVAERGRPAARRGWFP